MSQPESGTIGWSVVGQTDTFIDSPSGGTVPGVEISYQLADGTAGKVSVPLAVYRNLDALKAVISADAAHRHAVSQLTSQS